MELTKSKFRNLKVISFIDNHNQKCSIQDSSTINPNIWIGVDDLRMHLSIEQVETIIPILKKFVKKKRL